MNQRSLGLPSSETSPSLKLGSGIKPALVMPKFLVPFLFHATSFTTMCFVDPGKPLSMSSHLHIQALQIFETCTQCVCDAFVCAV